MTTSTLPPAFLEVWREAEHKTVSGLYRVLRSGVLELAPSEHEAVAFMLDEMEPKAREQQHRWRRRTFIKPTGEHVLIDVLELTLRHGAEALGLAPKEFPSPGWGPQEWQSNFYSFKQHATAPKGIEITMDSEGELWATAKYPCIYISRHITAESYVTELRDLFNELGRRLRSLTPEIEAWHILNDSPKTVALMHMTNDDVERELASSGALEYDDQLRAAMAEAEDKLQDALGDAKDELFSEVINSHGGNY